MNHPVRIYYISDYAYSRLIALAKQTKYVPYGSERVKGMSNFLNKLATYPMEDTRPELVKHRHQEEEKNNRAPTWLHTRMRRARLLKLSDDAIARYLIIAYQVGIIRAKPFAVGGPDRTTPYPTVSLVLEAIGLEWITPIELPFNVEVGV